MSNLLPCCHSWRKMQKCVLFCRARSWHTSLRLNTRQEHSENSNLNKWQTNWTKKKRQQNALGGFFTPWRVCTLLVARCSLRGGFWGFGSARCFISSCRISLRKASTWRQHGSTCHVIMSTCQPHYNTLSSCTSRVRHVKAEVTDSWEIFIRIDKVTKQYSRDSWKKKANKVVKIHELCWCLPFQESCMPMSWLWRDSKTPHGFYLIKLRKFQLKKRTVSFSRLQHFAIHSHQWRPHQLQRHLLLPVRSFPHSFIQDLTLQYQQHNNLLKPDIQISQTFHRLAALHENCQSLR